MKKATKVLLRLITISFLVFTFAYISIMQPFEKISILDNDVPLNDTVISGYTISQTAADITEIPDKYNTGCKGTLSTAKPGDTINDVLFAQTGNGQIVLDFYYKNKTFSGTLTIENYDFSAYTLNLSHESLVDRTISVVFKNCKFARINAGKDTATVSYEFDNCSINSFYGSNSTFNKCAFGKYCTDGLVPFQNITVNDSFFSDVASVSTTQDLHSDGTQLYGYEGIDLSNITYTNCRFEIPAVQAPGSKARVNACIMLQIEYSNANGIYFNNCIVNGGGYSVYARIKNSDYTMTNVSFNGLQVGDACVYGAFYGDIPDTSVFNNKSDTSNLYIGSIWKENGITHFSVTNDTCEERTLIIYTEEGIHEYTIPACPIGTELTDKTYQDLPFDIDITVNADCKYAVCYDQSQYATKQIRFANWSNEEVYIDSVDMANICGELYTEDTVIASGKCGDNIEYSLSYNGILTLSGTGVTYNYNSSNTTPFTAIKKYIKKVIVNEGITALGTQLFKNCSNISEVILPEGMTSIYNGAFHGCTSLTTIKIPSTLTDIGNYAFANTIIQNIKFDGTTDEWNIIKIGTNNSAINDTKIVQNVVEDIVLDSAMSCPSANQGICGNDVFYTISSDGTLTLTGTGTTYNYHSQKNAPWWDIRDSITKVVIQEGVTAVGQQLFRKCTNLTQVSLPTTLTKIDNNAFIGCSNLSKITIPKGVSYIGRYAFNSTGITQAVYSGNASEWSNVTVGENNTPFSMNLLMAETDPTDTLTQEIANTELLENTTEINTDTTTEEAAEQSETTDENVVEDIVSEETALEETVLEGTATEETVPEETIVANDSEDIVQ